MAGKRGTERDRQRGGESEGCRLHEVVNIFVHTCESAHTEMLVHIRVDVEGVRVVDSSCMLCKQ